MAHITIPTNSSSLYEYVKPFIIPIEKSDYNFNKKVKVFINGCWVGVTLQPIDLYNNMKNKKYQGIINIYTSIVFDYKNLEIRICNDGGRLTRPVLKVRNNKVLITKEKELAMGEMYDIYITAAEEFDLYGEYVAQARN